MQSNNSGRPVYIVDGARTPFLKVKGKPGPFSAADLGVLACRELLARQPFAASDIGEVITGCVMPAADEANISRVIALRAGCGNAVPAWTVQRNCASGLQAIDNAAQDIATGRHELVLVGGTEAMSRAPVMFSRAMVEWLSAWYAAKSWGQRARVIAAWRPQWLMPTFALVQGLNDPLVGLSMGQTAENLAYLFNITRLAMDEFALSSHQRLAAAQDQGYLAEIVPIYDQSGAFYTTDDGLRRDGTLGKLAQLKPIFDKVYGNVTAGNSSQVTDGAAFLILASEAALERYQLTALGKIIDVNWAGVAPEVMGLGPVHAVTPMLQRQGLQKDDIAYWEINEAFAAQVLACLAAWEDATYCLTHFGLPEAFGAIDRERLNRDGGAIALGHPVGASGARVVLHLLHTLRREKAQRGVATLCIGGGQGGAILIENMAVTNSEVTR